MCMRKLNSSTQLRNNKNPAVDFFGYIYSIPTQNIDIEAMSLFPFISTYFLVNFRYERQDYSAH